MTFYLCILFVLVVFLTYVDSNLRCYSCSPCNELEIYAGDVTHFEQDCYLDRYCMKVRRIWQLSKINRKNSWNHFWQKQFQISGITEDIFGLRREVSFRGCPWISIFTRLEEGCTGTSLEGIIILRIFFQKSFLKFFLVAGLGLVQGVVCFCQGHLCNGAISTSVPISMLSSIVSILLYFLISWNIPQKNRWL